MEAAVLLGFFGNHYEVPFLHSLLAKGKLYMVSWCGYRKSCTTLYIADSNKNRGPACLPEPHGDWSKFPIIRVLYLGSHYNTGPYISFPHFGNSNLGKLPHVHCLDFFLRLGF